jgi:periplasmic copper chaperone A
MKRLLAIACLAASISLMVSSVQAKENQVEVTGGWVAASLGNAKAGAAYPEIANHSDEEVSLVSVTTPVAERAELHTHRMSDGMMMMEKVERIDFAAGETIRLAPGGEHLMLFGLERPLKEGEKVPFVLTFSNGQTLDASLPVKSHKTQMQQHH